LAQPIPLHLKSLPVCCHGPKAALLLIQHTVRIVSGAKGDIPGGPIGGTSGPANALETRQRLNNKDLNIINDLSDNL
jgi:hypothetical protein